MRMPPNLEPFVVDRLQPDSFNGGRHAHAAEWADGGGHVDAGEGASMEGGMRMPPNRYQGDAWMG